MKVVEPGRRRSHLADAERKRPHDTEKRSRLFAGLIVVAFLAGIFWYVAQRDTHEAPEQQVTQQITPASDEQTAQDQTPPSRSNETYQSVWLSLVLPDTQVPDVAPDITSDTEFR